MCMARWLEKNMKFRKGGVTSYCQPRHFRPPFQILRDAPYSTTACAA